MRLTCVSLQSVLMVLALLLCIDVSSTWASAMQPRVRRLSGPRGTVFALEGIATAEECEHVLNVSSGRYTRSQMAGGVGEMRTSSSFYMSGAEMSSGILKTLVQRVERALESVVESTEDARVPKQLRVFAADPANAEAFQITEYNVGEYYGGHNDNHVEPRVATFLMYLDDTAVGGETAFPYLTDVTKVEKAKGKPSFPYVYSGQYQDYRQMKTCAEWDEATCGPENKPWFEYGRLEMIYCCCKEVLRVKPKRGTAVLFFPADVAGKRDPMTAHAACPVRVGVKHVVQQWYHESAPPQGAALHPELHDYSDSKGKEKGKGKGGGKKKKKKSKGQKSEL